MPLGPGQLAPWLQACLGWGGLPKEEPVPGLWAVKPTWRVSRWQKDTGEVQPLGCSDRLTSFPAGIRGLARQATGASPASVVSLVQGCPAVYGLAKERGPGQRRWRTRSARARGEPALGGVWRQQGHPLGGAGSGLPRSCPDPPGEALGWVGNGEVDEGKSRCTVGGGDGGCRMHVQEGRSVLLAAQGETTQGAPGPAFPPLPLPLSCGHLWARWREHVADRVFVSPRNSYVEALTPEGMVVGSGVFGR